VILVFLKVSNLSIITALIFKLFFKKVYYLEANANSFSYKLLNFCKIYPLPIDNLKINDQDFEEYIWDKNEKFKKYIEKRFGIANLKSISKVFNISYIKFLLILNDYYFPLKYKYIFKLNLFVKSQKNTRIFVVCFSIKDFFLNFKRNKFNLIFLPIEPFLIPIKFFIKLIKLIINNSLIFIRGFQKKKENKKIDKKKFNQSVAFWVHQSISYGKLFLKDHFYIKKNSSKLNKKNILHLYDTKNTIQKRNYYKLSFNLQNFIKLFFKDYKNVQKIITILKNNKKLYFSYDFIFLYLKFRFYIQEVKKLKNIKKILIDYDILAPKDLIIAFQENKKKVFSVCQRQDAILKKSFGVISDYYFIPNSYFKKKCINNNNIIVKKTNLIITGFYRSDYLKIKKKNILEIQKIKRSKKKIVTVFGYQGAENERVAKSEPLLNWTSCEHFLNNILILSKYFPNFYFVIRFKNINFLKNSYFKEITQNIKKTSNIKISQEYNVDKYSYILARNSDYIISQYTSILEECLSFKKKVIVYNFSKNIKKNFFEHDYLKNYRFCCKNLNEIKKSLSFFHRNEIKTQNIVNDFCKKNYFYSNKKNIIKSITDQILLTN
jgi:hypothetical protein